MTGAARPTPVVALSSGETVALRVNGGATAVAAMKAAAMPAEGIVVDVTDVAELEVIFEVVGDAGLAPERLRVRVPELVLLEEPQRAAAACREVAAAGLRLGVVGFGTGGTTIRTLDEVPADELVLAPDVVGELGVDRDAEAIALAVASVAGARGLRCTALGVTTWLQRMRVTMIGCTHAEGPAALGNGS